MSNDYKNHHAECLLHMKRCMIAFFAITVLMLLLIIRLLFLQIFHHDQYATLSNQNILDIVPIEPNRGEIFDRNGVLLAKNTPSFSLDIIPEKAKPIQQTIEKLKQFIDISDLDLKHFHRRLHQHHPFDSILLKAKLKPNELNHFYANQFQFPGVKIDTELLREYPMGRILSNIVGYVGRINPEEQKTIDASNYRATHYIGKRGIEKYYEPILHGESGSSVAEINASGRVIRQVSQTLPIAGKNLYLTIDAHLQAFINHAMGNESGAVVVIDPNTGDILSMVTKPDYDPNPFVTGLSIKAYRALQQTRDNPLFDRTIRGQFSPGSTIKPFYALAGLESKVITAQETIVDKGWFKLPNAKHIYHDWQPQGHGIVNLTKAITVSCDPYFYALAVKLGIHKMRGFLSRFGFGESTEIDTIGEAAGLLPSPEWKRSHRQEAWYTGDTILSGIGQGYVLTTPLQLANATATLAKRGIRHQPHLLYATKQEHQTLNTLPIKTLEPVVLNDPSHWQTVIHAMSLVITSPIGTGEHFGRHPTYTVAAKTGTAQLYGKNRNEINTRTNIPRKLRNNHLFIAFAPIQKPTIALAVVTEHEAQAAATARKILDYYFQHQHKPHHEQN